jgi:hypothetical protein
MKALLLVFLVTTSFTAALGDVVDLFVPVKPTRKPAMVSDEYSVVRSKQKDLLRNHPSVVRLRLPEGMGADTVVLSQRQLFAPGARISIVGATTSEHMLPQDLCYTGLHHGRPVALVVSPTVAILSVDKGTTIETIAPAQRDNRYVVTAQRLDEPFDCGTVESALPSVVKAMEKSTADVPQSETMLTLDIAIEADFRLVQALSGDVDRVRTHIQQVMALSTVIFERDLAASIRVSALRIWNVADDPYPDQLSVFNLIDTAVRYYEATMKDTPRDIVLFLTGRGGRGGIAASIGGLCEPAFSYCAADLLGTVQELPAWSWDLNVVTHEIGHVLGGIHTQSCLWPQGPLDSCVQSESGSCVSFFNTRPAIGTIMSYCHQTRARGGGIAMEFHPRHKQVMRSVLEQSSCVGASRVPQRNVLTGLVRHQNDSTPIAGVRLTIRPWLESYLFGTPASAGDTIAITDAQGRYRFDGLGNGLYIISFPEDVASMPLDLTQARDERAVAITDTAVTLDFFVLPAVPVEITVRHSGQDSADVVLHIVSSTLPGFSQTFTKSVDADTTVRFYRRSLPLADYTIVPAGFGRSYSPALLEVRPSGSALPLTIDVTPSEDPLNYTTAFVTVAFSNDRRQSLASSETVHLHARSSKGDRIPDEDVVVRTNRDGVASATLLDGGRIYRLRAQWDSTAWVDAFEPSTDVTGDELRAWFTYKRPRQFPMVARPRLFLVDRTAYDSLTIADTILLPPINSSAFFGQRVAAPFPLRFGARSFDSLWIGGGGYAATTSGSFFDFNARTVTSFERGPFVCVPLGVRQAYRNDAAGRGSIRARVRGEAPFRTWTIEWANTTIRYFDPNASQTINTGRFTYQMAIHERTGVIEFIYGPMAVENDTLSVPVEVGIRGGDNFDRLLVEPTGDVSWLNVGVTTGAPPDTTRLRLRTSATPLRGLVYRFVDLTTSVEASEATGPDIAPHPIPLGMEATVTGLPATWRITLTSLSGTIVREYHGSGPRCRLEVESLAAGAYLLSIHTGDASYTRSVLVAP